MELDYAKGWRPEEGDTIIGTVTSIDVGWSDQGGGKRYPIVTIKPEDGGDEVAVHCFHTALFNRMLTLRPQVGQRIGIQYKGQRPHKTRPRQSVAVYVARVEGGAGVDPWSALGGNGTPTAAPSDVPADASDFAPPQDDDDDDPIPF